LAGRRCCAAFIATLVGQVTRVANAADQQVRPTGKAVLLRRLAARRNTYGFGEVFFVSSVFVTVPSAFSFTVVSFDLVDPSLRTLVSSVLEIVRSQPINSDDPATIAIVAHNPILRFIRS
jgi:hypothetical protein